MTTHDEPRRHYRLKNFSRAFVLLRDALERPVKELNELEREGVIQRFEYTFELAWKTLKDRLEFDGLVLNPVTPRNVIRAAFKAKLIDDGEAWIDMLVDRNLMSHTYDFQKFEVVANQVRERYLCLLDRAVERLTSDLLES